MSGRPRLKFRHIRKKLEQLGINWRPDKGKGSHGSFVGPDRDGNKHSYTLPRSQQSFINRDYFNGLRHRFGLTGKKWTKFFDEQ